ncbi:MAG TPA: UDP-N-acetylglucosamine 1-carboxyvinyltransferase [Candidatus Limnocylindrales bacterium]|nr:UDP-N-acetylglucosamine 1-carboxyvinyltransferase [Candidatus Limnocylindrales bacterium]
MDKLVIQGGTRLAGEVEAGGAKNAALPLLFACLLTDEPCRLTNVPDVADIRTTARMLEALGARVDRPAPGELIVDCANVDKFEAPYDLVRRMRASFLTLGPLLARFGRARVSRPGGCAIGSRPIDIHLDGMRALGARIELDGGYANASADSLVGGHVIFSMPSVGATENVMMAAALAKGSTRIENAAREPEIVDLAGALVSMGANICGAGTSVIEIEGVAQLSGMQHAVVEDRIVAGTFLCGAAMTEGDVFVRGARADHLESLLETLTLAGCKIDIQPDGVRASMQGRPRPVDIVTAPFPGFPTDLQAQWMALMCLADGRCQIEERIFENRFMHVEELARMGAQIQINRGAAIVTGRPSLSGAPVMATDLRASVCLVLAGIAASGTTEVMRIYHLDRGYEHIEKKLALLGAQVSREKEGA